MRGNKSGGEHSSSLIWLTFSESLIIIYFCFFLTTLVLIIPFYGTNKSQILFRK